MKRSLFVAALLISMLCMLTACGKNDNTDTGENGTVVTTDVTLGQYKNIEVTLLELKVTDEDVESELYYKLSSLAAKTDRTVVENHDVVNIDFVGKLDDVAFDGGSAEAFDLQIGSKNFIDGFEDGLIGTAVGDTVDLNVTFPESYGSSDLAGKDVVFTVTVNSIMAMPELTDSIIAANTDYTTYADYYASVSESLQTSADSTIETQKQSDLIDFLIENSVITKDISEEITEYASNMLSMYEYYANYYGVTLEAFVYGSFGMTLDTFNEEVPKAAELSVKRKYVILAVAEAENITVSDDEYSEYADEMMTNYGYETLEDLETDYTKDSLMESILYNKALEFVTTNAVIK